MGITNLWQSYMNNVHENVLYLIIPLAILLMLAFVIFLIAVNVKTPENFKHKKSKKRNY